VLTFDVKTSLVLNYVLTPTTSINIFLPQVPAISTGTIEGSAKWVWTILDHRHVVKRMAHLLLPILFLSGSCDVLSLSHLSTTTLESRHGAHQRCKFKIAGWDSPNRPHYPAVKPVSSSAKQINEKARDILMQCVIRCQREASKLSNGMTRQGQMCEWLDFHATPPTSLGPFVPSAMLGFLDT
jgi:hypothetical protein